MRRLPADAPLSFDHAILINAAPARVLEAFFDPAALKAWWQTTRSVTTPRPLGVYAVEWEETADADEVLGALGGVFYGIVMEFIAGRELFVADAWWLPPVGEPIGPMSFHVTCTVEAAACRLRIRQSGFEDGPRWRRYYSVIERGWHISMAALKEHVESAASP